MAGGVPPSLIRLGINVIISFTICKAFPQYLPEHALLYVFLRLLGIQLALVAVYKVGIYPFFISPLRHLPGPGLKVSQLFQCIRGTILTETGLQTTPRTWPYNLRATSWLERSKVDEDDPE